MEQAVKTTKELPTFEKIMATPVGRELDALVAQYLMDWVWLNHNEVSILVPRSFVFSDRDFNWMHPFLGETPLYSKRETLSAGWFRAGLTLPHYSTTDIDDAMAIANADCWRYSLTHEDNGYFCEIRARYWTSYSLVAMSHGKTAQEAICRAALKFVVAEALCQS